MRNKLDFYDYFNKLNNEDKEWIRKFYQEYYYGEYGDDGKMIITDKKMRAEANRNHNRRKTDAFEVGTLTYLNESETRVMEDASDNWSWTDCYTVGGFEMAREDITNRTTSSIKEGVVDIKVLLDRHYVQMDQLRRHHQRCTKK